MKFYVNRKMITPQDQPLILILTDQDKKNIAKMLPDANIYCMYETENDSSKDVLALMDEAKGKSEK